MHIFSKCTKDLALEIIIQNPNSANKSAFAKKVHKANMKIMISTR